MDSEFDLFPDLYITYNTLMQVAWVLIITYAIYEHLNESKF